MGDGVFPADGRRLRFALVHAFAPSGAVRECKLGFAFLILTRISLDTDKVRFKTPKVPLDVARDWERFLLDFPVHPGVVVVSLPQLLDGLGEPDLEIETRCPSDISCAAAGRSVRIEATGSVSAV